MITKFDSLFAGHVDMEDVGYAGTAVNDRKFDNDHLSTAFEKGEAIAKVLDRCGFDTFWMAEHHFQPEGYECIPNIMQLSVHMAHLTDNIKFGCGFNIAPMWHPLRMAEDYATADILTGGRMIFGVGRGYHTREVEVFGNPMLDADANRDLFEEQVDVIMKAFKHESFSHHGKNYDIPPDVPYRGYDLKEITLVPRPVNPVETWQPIVSASERGLNFMAKHGIKGIIGGGAAVGGGALSRPHLPFLAGPSHLAHVTVEGVHFGFKSVGDINVEVRRFRAEHIHFLHFMRLKALHEMFRERLVVACIREHGVQCHSSAVVMISVSNVRPVGVKYINIGR